MLALEGLFASRMEHMRCTHLTVGKPESRPSLCSSMKQHAAGSTQRPPQPTDFAWLLNQTAVSRVKSSAGVRSRQSDYDVRRQQQGNGSCWARDRQNGLAGPQKLGLKGVTNPQVCVGNHLHCMWHRPERTEVPLSALCPQLPPHRHPANQAVCRHLKDPDTTPQPQN
jgi:hypothetical protein